MASRLRILTWNTWLQIDPSSKPNPNPDKRAPLIADKLSASNRDILLLQKVWSNRDELIDGINKEFVYISEKINDKHGLNLHAGLLTVSRFKLKFLGSIDFEETLGIEGMFSNKGAALWEGVWEDNIFQLASVHLQGHASSDKQQAKLPATRRAQLRQLCKELLNPHLRPKVPQIICGDFSINYGTSDYGDVLEILDAEDGPITGKVPYTAYGREKGMYPNDIGRDFINNPETLDYILLRNHKSELIEVTVTRTVRRYIEVWKARDGKTYQNLAYRYALEGNIDFSVDKEEIDTEQSGTEEELNNPMPLYIAAEHLL